MSTRSPFRPLNFIHVLLAVVIAAASATVQATPASAQAAVDRLSGPDRYATAAAISGSTFEPRGAVAFIATGSDFPDSLAGGPAAAALGAPILLTTRTGLPAATRAELTRLQPGRIAVLGGEGVISSAVLSELQGLTAGGVVRHAGGDRYATAAEISRSHFAPGAPVAYVATGRSFPDALAAGAAAAASKGPVLLVDTNAIPAAAHAELSRLAPQRIVVVGGSGVVSDAVLNGLRQYTTGSVTRQAGATRYGTAAAISAAMFPPEGGATVYLASGLGFADAVAGVPAAAAAGAPLLLSSTTFLPSETSAEMRRLNPSRVVLLGGTGALSAGVATAAAAVSSLTLIGPWAFVKDEFSLQALPIDQLIYYGDTVLELYGTRDATGAYMQEIGGVLYDHPVGQAQYLVNMLRNLRLTGEQRYLDIAIANGNRLLDRAVEHRGGIFFPYGFDFALHGRGTMEAPWYSGMAQGIALSGFVRLYEWTGDPKWLDAAHRTYASFLVPREIGKPWVTGVDRGLLWFEEYPWTPFDHTWNGHNFAIFGLLDYWRLTGSEDARQLVLGGLTTTSRTSAKVRVPGGVSNYCLAQSCLDRRVRNRGYHTVHISQALYLHRYTRNEAFAVLADNFVADYPDFRYSGTTVFAPGEHVAYQFNSDGTGAPADSSDFSSLSTAPYAERSVPYGWSNPGNGIWFFINGGAFEGLWVRETAQAYARGFVDRYGYLWDRPRAIAAGTWTGYRFDATGVITETQTVATGATTWYYTSSARINGQRAVLLSSGPLSGFWLPPSPDASFGVTGAGGGLRAAGADDPAAQRDESPGSVAAPPAPEASDLPEPQPGQMDPPPFEAP